MRYSASRSTPHWALLLASALLLAAGGAAGAQKPRYRGDLAGLERVADRRLDELYRRPGVDLSRYGSAIVEPVGLDLDLKPNDYRYEESDLRFVQREFREHVLAALAPRLRAVEEPGPGVLQLRLTLTEIRSNRRPLDRGPKAPGDVLWHSRGVGAAAMQLELRDAQSGELLLAAADRYQGWDFLDNQNLNTTWGDAKRAFDAWGRTLRRLLEGARASTAAR